MTLSVRPAAPPDLDAVCALDAQAATDTGRRTWLTAAVHGEKGRIATVAVQDGEIVGLVVVGEFFGHPFVELLRASPAHRRQGVASLLMDAVEARSRGDRVFVSTNESNTAMRTLLIDRDYKVSGVVENLDASGPELFFVKFR